MGINEGGIYDLFCWLSGEEFECKKIYILISRRIVMFLLLSVSIGDLDHYIFWTAFWLIYTNNSHVQGVIAFHTDRAAAKFVIRMQ